jgi:hypothetical protein
MEGRGGGEAQGVADPPPLSPKKVATVKVPNSNVPTCQGAKFTKVPTQPIVDVKKCQNLLGCSLIVKNIPLETVFMY